MYSLLLAIFAVIMLVMTEKLKNGTVPKGYCSTQ